MVNPPPEGLLAWLEHPYPAAPIKDLPRESIETHFVADEQHNQGSGIASDTRNSLDDLLQSYSSANNEFPEAIALPKSLAESSTSTGEPYIEQQSNDHREEDDALRTSLEVCLEPKFSVVPSDIPLPKSRPSSPGQYREELPLVLSGTGPLKEKGRVLSPYKTVIESAGHVLDHIKDGNIVKESRHNRTSITFYDYINNVEAIPRKIFDVENIVPLSYAPPEVKQRLILVEDISKPTIDALGETFSINPEFFEEHLLNSGYAGAEYDQPSTQTWKTRSLEKSYMSLKWIRPVYRLPTYFSNRDLEDLLEDSTEHFTRHGNVKTRVVTNIFRSDWSLSADPAKTVRMKRECGLEERISVWKGKLMNQACDVVIVLLDPLPKITESHRFWTPNNRRGIGDDSGYDFLQESFIADSDDMEDGLHYLFDEEPRRVRDNRRSGRFWTVRRTPRQPIRIVEWDDKSQHKVIVEHIAPRRAVIVDLDTVFRTPRSTMKFGKELNETKSTQTEICEGLRFSEGSISLIKPLFHIIKQDTLTLLNQLCRILDEVEVEILDDTKMENRLALWRRLIGRAQRELPELKASLGPFLAFLDTIQSPSATDNCAATKSEVKEDLRKLSTEIDGIVDRLRRTSTYLTSNIGLLDSRRSIDETRAVTRLTELAFVFIPLSFATSFFGMQVEPFANPVPIWKFFAVAIGVTTFSYMMRMIIRSQWLTSLKTAMKHNVRRYADRHGEPVHPRSLPMFLIVRWLGNWLSMSILKVWQWIVKQSLWAAQTLWAVFGFAISFILLNCAVSAAPIAIIWTRDLDSGIQGAVSIAIMIIVIAFVGVPFWYRSEPTFRSALPKIILSGISSTLSPRWARIKLFFLITSAISILVPLVLIWTHPLAAGIKSALTAGIVMIESLVLVTIILWWRLS